VPFFCRPLGGFLLPFARFLFVLAIFFLTLMYFLLRLFFVLVCFFFVLAGHFFDLFGVLLGFALTFFGGLLVLLFGVFGGFSLFGGRLGFGFLGLPFSFDRSAWPFPFLPALSGQSRAEFVPVDVSSCITYFEYQAAFRHRTDQFSTRFLGRLWHGPPELFGCPSRSLIEPSASCFTTTVDRDPHFGFGWPCRASFLRHAGGCRRRQLARPIEDDRTSGRYRRSDQQAEDQSSAPRL
jgi:hypothetical protein